MYTGIKTKASQHYFEKLRNSIRLEFSMQFESNCMSDTSCTLTQGKVFLDSRAVELYVVRVKLLDIIGIKVFTSSLLR